jgi:aspartyl-tRNA(Asn)/glutamyl-tRNA(Gln) amidotransferase subunit C
MEVTDQLLDHLAALARLKIEPSERIALRHDLSKMIAFIEQLQQLNTHGIEPLLHMTEEIDRIRKDEIKSEISRETALSAAKTKDASFFKVPKVIKK